MRKTFNLTITSALASAFLGACAQDNEGADWEDNSSGYSRSDIAVCVDGQGHRIDDDYCDDDRDHHHGGSFIYLARGSYIPYHGERAWAGTYSNTPRPGTTYLRPPASTNMTRSAAISRGGFGSSARSSGGYSSARS
jgi:uncharacterized protein YgiB involved in biofilm formation